MKKIFLLTIASVMTVFAMAIGRNDGSTKANAIDFDWDSGVTHAAGTKWYRVDLAPLYEEENPSLTLYLTNPSNAVGTSVDVSMQATVAGQSESKDYSIAARQYKTYTANASMLVRMKQTEIYLTLTSTGKIKLSAKVFEAADLDETCKDARTLAWDTETTQEPSYSAWWKVSLKPIKDVTGFDAQVTLTNTGAKTVNLRIGQSLDCPSSGLTKREYELAPGDSIVKKIPRDMIASVQPDELYFGIENVESKVSIKVEKVAQPPVPVIPAAFIMPGQNLHVTDTIESLPVGTTLYKISVADMDSLAKYEPEFTYRNAGTTPAHVKIQMAFNRPANSTSDVDYDLAEGEEEIVVYKKNMLEGMEGVDSIYLLTTVTGTVNFYGRFKHVREGKACKTNIDFNWVSGHTQEARTTQWYAIDVADARDNLKDIMIYVLNQGNASAKVNASMAFSCPYIDLQEMSRTLAANGDTLKRRLGYSSYAMMSDTVWIGLETSQNIKFWADTIDAKKKDVVDTICLHAATFNWDEGVMLDADTSVWYRIDMDEVRAKAAKFPTVFVQNLSSSAAAVITAELSVECPDSIANQSRKLTIAANESYSKQLSRNLFENIVQEEIYIKVHSTQAISLQIRLTEEAEGASCSSAIPFNWVSGNTQGANENLWYSVDLRKVMERGNDLRLHLENRENASCKGVIQLSYECPVEAVPSIQDFKLAANGTKSVTIQNSALETLEDSIVYVNLQGTTGLRFWADTLAVQHFDTIFADNITLIPLLWDSLYTQTVDTAWYIIPKSEIDMVKNLDEKVKPVAHLINLAGAKTTVKGEAAFAFPIGKKMMTKTQELKANQHYTDTIPASTFDQFLKKDSIIIRITRPVGAGNFQFRAELVKAFSGNSRYDAQAIRLGEKYTQAPMSSMWWKINTADWKKDKNLFNKVLNVMTKNAGAGDAKVNVAVFEGLLSNEDLLEKYGLGDYRERTVKKGQGKSHNIPAQAVYGLGDVELYIQVTTTDSLVFATEFAGTYAPQAVDPKQAEALLVVPNVDYVIPGDNQEHWYQVCIPYIRNNYKYVHAATLAYEVNGKVTIEGTATFQDQMDCKMPVRKRTVGKDGYHKGTKPLSELLAKGIKKATGRDFDLTTFQEDFIDEMLRRYITSDSITGYVRIKSDKDIKVRLNMPQTKGDACGTPVEFDWEHGNVNPAGARTWYHVDLDSLLIPDTCDLRIHVDNWSTSAANNIVADMYFDCNEPKTKGKNYTLPAGGKDSIDIDRDFMSKMGWADLIIDYTSDQVSHIWAELVPNKPRECDYDTIREYVCYGGSYLDTITGITISPITYSIEWNDTVAWKSGVTMRDSVTTFYIRPLVTPEEITIDSMKSLGAAPLLVQGMQLFVDSSSIKLTQYYKNIGNTVDTVSKIDTVYWAKPVYDAYNVLDITQEAALDLTSYYKKTDLMDTLLLVIVPDSCGTPYRKDIVFTLGEYKYTTIYDTLCPPVSAKPDTLPSVVPVIDPTLNRLRMIDTILTHVARIAPTLYTQAELLLLPKVVANTPIDTTNTLRSMYQQFEDDALKITMKVTDIKWQVKLPDDTWQDMPYTVPANATSVTMRYLVTTECTDVLTSGNIVLTVGPAPCPTVQYATPENDSTYCITYNWSRNGKDYSTVGPHYDTLKTKNGLCDSIIYTLNLKFMTAAKPTAEMVSTYCTAYKWAKNNKTYTTNGMYFDTIKSLVDGCDSIIYSLNLTFETAAKPTAEIVSTYCSSYKWAKNNKTYTTTGLYYDTIPSFVDGCDSIIFTLNLTFEDAAKPAAEIVSTYCSSYKWAKNNKTYTTTGKHYDTIPSFVDGCDSIIYTLDLTFDTATIVPETQASCITYNWDKNGKDYTTSGTYYDTIASLVDGCDSLIYKLNLTINQPVTHKDSALNNCNFYKWAQTGVTYYKDTVVVDTLFGQAANTCDSIVIMKITISNPQIDELPAEQKYGNRLLMINRIAINKMKGWENVLDSIDPGYVVWYKMKGAVKDITVDDLCATGYYYTRPDGEPLVGDYYAYIELPKTSTDPCPHIGTTKVLHCPAASGAAPALMPTLARPGEDLTIINLDADQTYTVRMYSTDGLLQSTFTVQGETRYIIKAALDHGFYIVELSNDNMKSTLRYIVK